MQFGAVLQQIYLDDVRIRVSTHTHVYVVACTNICRQFTYICILE